MQNNPSLSHERGEDCHLARSETRSSDGSQREERSPTRIRNSVLYHIPICMLKDYQKGDIVVRAHDPSDFPRYLSEADLQRIAYLQLLSLSADTDCLTRWGERIPLDLVMNDPEKEFPLLYRFSGLLNKHPVRVSVPLVSGFSKAIKLAASLNFAVRITGGQPDAALNGEITDALNLYLHNPTVSQPIEFFHSILTAFFHEKPVSLLTIQEEDPMHFRYITEQGEEAISERFAALGMTGGAAIATFLQEVPEAREGCPDCEFLLHCRGYFKWPQKDYPCELVIRIFRILKNAAGELKKDYIASLERPGENKA